MTNHPNRNWRRAMHTSADAYLSRCRWPEGGGTHVMSSEQLRAALRAAYLAGYTDGRTAALPARGRSNDPS